LSVLFLFLCALLTNWLNKDVNCPEIGPLSAL
jgi:hypothetical protein